MSGILLIVMLVVLIVVHELGHFAAAKWLKVRVQEFGIGYPPRALLLGVVRGTQYTINWLPFGGFVRLLEEDGAEDPDRLKRSGSFAAAPKWKQAIILLAGVAANAVFGWLLFAGGFMSGMPVVVSEPAADAHLLVTTVVPGSPAEHAGLHVGDQILSVTEGGKAGAPVLTPEAVVEFVRTRGGKSLDVSYQRNGATAEITLRPAHAILPDTPSQPAIGMGLALVAEKRLSFFPALVEAGVHTARALESITLGMWRLAQAALIGAADIRVLVGPVGLAGAVGDAASHGLGELFGLAALISINLVIINLLPIPALDGGRLVFVAIEAVRGRKISRTAAQIMNALGFALIITLMIAVTYNDIARIIG
ncbi:MAG: site-2 protease family protein [Parcubacteria group bacterium]|nr:site-2 protease family protein [Parcubacteria group bacterium]